MLRTYLVTYEYFGRVHHKFTTEREVYECFDSLDEIQWIMDALNIPSEAFDTMTIMRDDLVATYIS